MGLCSTAQNLRKTRHMDRWSGRTALVTGASAGIGRAIASRLVKHGLTVVACARRLDRLEELRSSLVGQRGRIIPIQCDTRKEEEILSMFDRIRSEVEGGGVDICVNNAGIGRFTSLLDGSTDHWREMLELNVLGTCICTRETIKSMRERGVDDGFIINIGSISGNNYFWQKGLSFYGGTKHAVAWISKGLISELNDAKSRIRVMEIDPGLVETEILAHSVGKEKADKFFASIEALSVEDIADCVVFGLSASPKARVSSLTIEPAQYVDLRRARDT